MAVARRTEGPRAPLFFATPSVVALAALLSVGSALSQTVEVATLEQCVAMETEELKLRCFEAIIASSTSGDNEQPEMQESRADDPPAPASPAVAAGIKDTADEVAAVTPPVDQAFGQEHLARQEKAQQARAASLRATVIEVSRGRRDYLYFHLDDGQVWRQIEARHYAYPKDGEFEVNISRGMMGEYRMRIGDNGRMVRIRRVK